MNKQFIDLNEIDIFEEIDFELLDHPEKGSGSMNAPVINVTTPATEEKKPKYIRKTIYINRDYLDVLEFFERKNSSMHICELIRETLQKEKGLGSQPNLTAIMEAINELKDKME